MTDRAIGASFRDPSGFIFQADGRIHRQVNRSYADDYDQLMSSGLYEELVGKQLLVSHEEVESPIGISQDHYRPLRPEPIPTISYPYEWCFSQL